MNRNIIVISGMSGAGKTTTMSIFEDMNFLPIDNLPHSLLNQFVFELSNDASSYYQNVVLGVNIIYFERFLKAIEDANLSVKIILLTASTEELLRRYNYNRRSHPLILQQKAGNDIEAIDFERNIFDRVKDESHIVIDTTYLSKKQLISQLETIERLKFNYQLSIVFESFGFRKGIPLDADFVFDVRFLDNPYWEKSMRLLTGEDQEVIDFIHQDAKYQPFMDRLIGLIDQVVAGNINMDRSNLVIAIGCTGGQHRSVMIANELTRHYMEQLHLEAFSSIATNGYSVSVFHRDKEVNRELLVKQEQNS